jgi:hypothetical protein
MRVSEAEYAISDSNIVTDTVQGNSGRAPGYEKYGYYIGNKFQTMNLFSYMSLYTVMNRKCHRIDLINPYLQSMQHDQFSQEMSAELAQNTVTWGYENVVYYGRNTIEKEDALMGVIGGKSSNIFHWDTPTYATSPKTPEVVDRHFGNPGSASGSYVHTGRDNVILPGKSPLTDAQSMATGPLESSDIKFYQTYGPGLGGYKPKSTLGNRFPGPNITEAYRALAAPHGESVTEKKTREEQRRALDIINAGAFNFSAKDFKDPTGIDKIKALGGKSNPAVGVNHRPAIDKPWLNSNDYPADEDIWTSGDSFDKNATVAYIAQQLGAPQTNNPASDAPDDPPSDR